MIKKHKIKKAIVKLRKELERDPYPEEIVMEVNLDLEEVLRVLYDNLF